jgi:hypothetical protein
VGREHLSAFFVCLVEEHCSWALGGVGKIHESI